MVKNYGKELILDIHNCDAKTFTREHIEKYMKRLCDAIDMERCELFFWDDFGLPPEECQTEPHLKGTSAVQFIMTSNVTIHTLDIMERVYLNIFSCKDFDSDVATRVSLEAFSGNVIHKQEVDRL